MAIIERSEYELALERQQELEDREIALAAENRRNEHALRLAKLKYATMPRYKAISAIAKIPALGIALVCITVLVICDKKVPDSLTKFITL